ncbi:MAG: hypothetical protein OEZ58_03355, partial [Gammaproteobacteria bacterium]|nr:hypothetical protein [Gammaproteobacteria bacterium]
TYFVFIIVAAFVLPMNAVATSPEKNLKISIDSRFMNVFAKESDPAYLGLANVDSETVSSEAAYILVGPRLGLQTVFPVETVPGLNLAYEYSLNLYPWLYYSYSMGPFSGRLSGGQAFNINALAQVEYEFKTNWYFNIASGLLYQFMFVKGDNQTLAPYTAYTREYSVHSVDGVIDLGLRHHHSPQLDIFTNFQMALWLPYTKVDFQLIDGRPKLERKLSLGLVLGVAFTY